MPTLEQAKKVHAKLLADEIEGEWKFLGGVLNKTEWRVNFPGGSWIQWVSAERADNVRGIRCDFVSVDEADDIDPEIFDAIIIPWFSELHSLRKVLISGTPRRGRHGLLWKAYKVWPETQPNHHAFHATGYDAPLLVDPGYLRDMESKMVPEIFKREWLCDFDSAEGLVYPMFNEEIHVVPAEPRGRYHEFIVGADFGFVDPTVILVCGIKGHGRDARIHVIEEFYRSGQTKSYWEEKVRYVLRKYPRERGVRWYPDSAEPQIIEEWRQLGARIEDVNKSIFEGICAVADRMIVKKDANGQEYTRFYVDPSCVNTIRELGMYRYKRDPRNKELLVDSPEDKNNHALDALRYAIFNRFGGPESVRIEYPDTAFKYG